jgi:hypothetical protein
MEINLVLSLRLIDILIYLYCGKGKLQKRSYKSGRFSNTHPSYACFYAFSNSLYDL